MSGKDSGGALTSAAHAAPAYFLEPTVREPGEF